MDGKGSNTSTSTTVASNAPWAPSQPYLTNYMAAGDNLYKSGVGMQDWTGPTYVPFSDYSTQGHDMALGASDAAAPGLTNAFSTVGKQLDYWSPIARGDFSSNPDFTRMYDKTLSDTANSVNNQFSMDGRYGSGMHTGALTSSLADAGSKMKLDYQNFANTILGQSAGQMGDLFKSTLMPAQTKMDVGAQYEGLAKNELDDQIRKWQFSQTAPWEQLARAMANATGAGSLGSSSTSSVTAKTPNTSGSSFLNTLLGGGLSLAAALA